MPDGSTNSYCGFLDNQTIPFVPSSMGNSRWSLFAFQVCQYQSRPTQNDAHKIWGILSPLVPLSLIHSLNLSLLLCAYGLPPTIFHSLPVRTSYVKVSPLISSVIPSFLFSVSAMDTPVVARSVSVVGLRGPPSSRLSCCMSIPLFPERRRRSPISASQAGTHWTDGRARDSLTFALLFMHSGHVSVGGHP